MKNCPKCNAPLADDAAFCGNCGANLGEIPQPPVQDSGEATPKDGETCGNPPRGNGVNPPPYYYPPYGNGTNPPPYYGPQGDGSGPYYGPGYGYQPPQPPPWDHSGEFEPRDVSENKVLAMMPYLMGSIGLIIALLAMHDSKYVGFHVRQAMKLTVVNILLVLVSVLLCWTVIVPIVGAVCAIIVFVLRIIAFFQVCTGKAKEPAIIRKLGFLK